MAKKPLNTGVNHIKEMLDTLDKHLESKFPKGVAELRNYIFNTHAKLEQWMGAAINRASFATVESSDLGPDLKGRIMGDASIEINRLLTVMEFHAILKAFLKGVEDTKLRKELEDKISAVNRIRNEFAHPYGYFDLKHYNINLSDGVHNQVKALEILCSSLDVMERYLTKYHNSWYEDVKKLK